MGNPEDFVVGSLAPPFRMALAHAPRRLRTATAALFALDARLGAIVRRSHEPMLAQLRLAWWRDQLGASPAGWPAGEPVLAALRCWGGGHAALGSLVDGWEALIGEAPLPDDRFEQFVGGRAEGFAALAGIAGAAAWAGETRRAAREWALADLAGRLTDPRERATVSAMADAQSWSPARLPRALRPLAVLHGLARRERQGGAPGIGALAAGLRIGLIGR